MNTLIKAIKDFVNGGDRVFEKTGDKYYFVLGGNYVFVYINRDPEDPKLKHARYTVPRDINDFACW